MKTLSSILRRASQTNFGISFYNLSGESRTTSYRDFDARADLFAHHLIDMGVQKGEVIALCLITNEFFVEAFFGVLRAGAVPVCSYPPMKLGDHSSWAKRTSANWNHVGAKRVITEDVLNGLVSHASTLSGIALLTQKNFKKLSPVYELPEVNSQDLAFLQFSSGTTGASKAVALTNKAVLENIEMIVSSFDTHQHSCVSWLPLYHDMGLVGAFLSSLYVARPLALIRPDHFLARPRLWLEVLTKTKATISVAPNFAFGLCTKRVTSLDGLDLSHWSVALCGAETVHADTLNKFIQKFEAAHFDPTALTPVYGMAEVALAATFSSLHEKPRWRRFNMKMLTSEQRAQEVSEAQDGFVELSSVGRPLKGVELQILSRDERVCEEGELGEVLLRSPSLMREYFNDPELTQENIVEGFLRTGDLGFIYEGELYLFGRKKEIIIHKGRNIDPCHIEISLRDISEIRSGRIAACSAINPASGEEGFYLFAECSSEVGLNENEEKLLKRKIEAQIVREAGIKPFEIILLAPGSLPRTSSGKIQRSLVMRLWVSDQLLPKSTGGIVRFGLLSLTGHLKQLGERLL